MLLKQAEAINAMYNIIVWFTLLIRLQKYLGSLIYFMCTWNITPTVFTPGNILDISINIEKMDPFIALLDNCAETLRNFEPPSAFHDLT